LAIAAIAFRERIYSWIQEAYNTTQSTNAVTQNILTHSHRQSSENHLSLTDNQSVVENHSPQHSETDTSETSAPLETDPNQELKNILANLKPLDGMTPQQFRKELGFDPDFTIFDTDPQNS
jgi:hypothetical protein